MECAMPDEVAADHSGIPMPPSEKKPLYDQLSKLLTSHLGLEMPAANVKLLGEVLGGAHRNEAKRPSRSGLIESLTELCDAAHKISNALVSGPILSWLAEARPDLHEKWPDHWVDNQDLAQAAEAALLLVPKGGGRTRSATPREISPRATCALFVVEMFELSGKKRPSSSDAKAHAIAEALWLSSGGLPWTGHAKNLASWRRYFDETTKASPGYRDVLREFVRRRLSVRN